MLLTLGIVEVTLVKRCLWSYIENEEKHGLWSYFENQKNISKKSQGVEMEVQLKNFMLTQITEPDDTING